MEIPFLMNRDNQSIVDLRNLTFRYLGNCNCMIKHDKKGIYCSDKNKKDCAVLDHIPDFNYVCGGSGVLMNRWVDRWIGSKIGWVELIGL